MKKVQLVIIGSGGHSRVVLDTSKATGFELSGIIDIDYKVEKELIFGIPIIGGISELDKLDPDKVTVIIALGDNTKRAKYYKMAQMRTYPFDDDQDKDKYTDTSRTRYSGWLF